MQIPSPQVLLGIFHESVPICVGTEVVKTPGVHLPDREFRILFEQKPANRVTHSLRPWLRQLHGRKSHQVEKESAPSLHNWRLVSVALRKDTSGLQQQAERMNGRTTETSGSCRRPSLE